MANLCCTHHARAIALPGQLIKIFTAEEKYYMLRKERPFYLIPAIINIYKKVRNLIHNWIYPLMGKVHRNVHTRMHILQVYELPQQELP